MWEDLFSLFLLVQIIILVIAITLIVVFKLILLWSNFYSTFIVKCIPAVPGQYPKYLSIFLRPVKSLYWSHFSYARQVSEALFLPTPLECTTESLVSFPSWGTPLWRDYLVCYSDITIVYGNDNGRAMVCFSSTGRQAASIGNYMAGT